MPTQLPPPAVPQTQPVPRQYTNEQVMAALCDFPVMFSVVLDMNVTKVQVRDALRGYMEKHFPERLAELSAGQ